MKAFIFKDLSQVSSNYHTEGGLVVIAKDETHVNKLISQEKYDIEITEQEWEDVQVFDLDCTHKTYDAQVFVFPDAGCC